MTFDTLGDPCAPAVMLIHGMLCTSLNCEPFGRSLSDKYFVIMPTLDGHCNDGSELVSAEAEAAAIAGYLSDAKIERLELLQGSSMGAEIALAVLKTLTANGIEVGCCVFDGGPFFDFHPLFRKFMYGVFRKMTRIFDTDDPEKAVNDMMKNGFLKFVGGKKAKQFRPIVKAMANEKRTFSDRSVQGMVDICYRCALPEFDEDIQRRMVFLFSDEEPARKSMKRLLKAYPAARYRDIHGYPHCGLQTAKPTAYAKLLDKMIIDIGK